MSIQLPEHLRHAEEHLNQLIQRHYVARHGEVVRYQVEKNVIGEDRFVEVHFQDGFWCTFCLSADDYHWFRHSGGGRYGPRSKYEGWQRNAVEEGGRMKRVLKSALRQNVFGSWMIKDPTALLNECVEFDGQTPIYLLPDPDDNELVWVSNAPFTVEDIEKVKSAD